MAGMLTSPVVHHDGGCCLQSARMPQGARRRHLSPSAAGSCASAHAAVRANTGSSKTMQSTLKFAATAGSCCGELSRWPTLKAWLAFSFQTSSEIWNESTTAEHWTARRSLSEHLLICTNVADEIR